VALEPKLLIADEPTTALDVTIQAQVLDLLQQTKRRGKTLILISHDLAVVAQLADHVLVMRIGEIVERGPVAKVLRLPSHPYTRGLLDSIPSVHSRGTRLSPSGTAAVAPMAIEVNATFVPVVSRPARSGPVLEASSLVKRFRAPDGTCTPSSTTSRSPSIPGRRSGLWASRARARPPPLESRSR
jgi:peptide/nickel transport system ATP-binding protein